ncbi:type II toxin-antitoxin system VapB family antitoxin [Actinoplanes sp. TBRC 11911]|uniref:type II toxin-antitoxin system VapB family antitoxin n=1 Tax=Actinoplanes sp. TBRC 11911 TaxID=2729386 RepID=UPI00145F6045|nr:type II toxin-antitoxin system VapB family antitoxin [Actinoplanes sp. TBRC 11911]NMO51424.1 type II toxin-antitoxin system VapB family antitoxin [Actinoplanes sp. TBRC 11911]
MTDLLHNPEIETNVGVEVEIDAELLAEAQRQISAPSINATINEALRRLVETERGKRRDALAELREMVQAGEINFRHLDGLHE